MWLKFFNLPVEGDFESAHYGTRRAPEHVLQLCYQFSTVKLLSLSTALISLYRRYPVLNLKHAHQHLYGYTDAAWYLDLTAPMIYPDALLQDA